MPVDGVKFDSRELYGEVVRAEGEALGNVYDKGKMGAVRDRAFARW